MSEVPSIGPNMRLTITLGATVVVMGVVFAAGQQYADMRRVPADIENLRTEMKEGFLALGSQLDSNTMDRWRGRDMSLDREAVQRAFDAWTDLNNLTHITLPKINRNE